MNPKARSPEMKPIGSKQPDIYILGSAPGEIDDAQDQPFVGKAGRRLRRELNDECKTRFDYIVRTRTPGDRAPKREEIECFRETVEKSIEAAAPKLILGVGTQVLMWATGFTNILGARGKLYPVKIRGHLCWFMPIMDPTVLEKIEDKRFEKVPGREWIRYWCQDIENALGYVKDGLPEAKIITPEQAKKGIKLCKTLSEVREAFEVLRRSKMVGWDIEMG